jgi:hypothetical protein
MLDAPAKSLERVIEQRATDFADLQIGKRANNPTSRL